MQYTRMNTLDPIDRQLLIALQRNASATAQDLSDTLHLSPSQIGRRKQRLEAAGYITGTTTRLDADRLGLRVQAIVQVHTSAHAAETHHAFRALVDTRAEITDAWTLTGDADYLMRVYCADLSALNVFIQEVLLPHPAIARVQSQIVMEQLKAGGPLPL